MRFVQKERRYRMSDYTALFKAFIVPYIICCSLTTICFLWVTDQEIPQLLWVIFVGGLGAEGIDIGIRKVTKK